MMRVVSLGTMEIIEITRFKVRKKKKRSSGFGYLDIQAEYKVSDYEAIRRKIRKGKIRKKVIMSIFFFLIVLPTVKKRKLFILWC